MIHDYTCHAPHQLPHPLTSNDPTSEASDSGRDFNLAGVVFTLTSTLLLTVTPRFRLLGTLTHSELTFGEEGTLVSPFVVTESNEPELKQFAAFSRRFVNLCGTRLLAGLTGS